MFHSIRILSLVWLSLLFTTRAGAQDTFYVNAKWHKATKETATYFRVAKKLADNRYEVRDYYANGKLQMLGYYSYLPDLSNEPAGGIARNGHFTYYVNGSGTITDEGEYKNGKKEGLWKYYYVNTGKLKSTVIFSNGLANGETFRYDSLTRSMVLKGQYKDEAKVGTWYTYFIDGALSGERHYADGDTEVVKEYYANGKLGATGIYVENEREGEWYHYDGTTGNLLSTDHYEHGAVKGLCRMYWRYPYKKAAPQVSIEAEISGKKRNGFVKKYDSATGKLTSLEHYVEDVLDGPFIYYFNNGVIETGSFKKQLPSGEWRVFVNDTSRLRSVTHYTDSGKGYCIGYDSLGWKAAEGPMLFQYKSGFWKYYNSKGRLRFTCTLERDYTVTGITSYYDTLTGRKTKEVMAITGDTALAHYTGYAATYYGPNAPETEGYMTNGKHSGEWKGYFRTGRLRYIAHYTDDSLNGTVTHYDSLTGKRSTEIRYVMDKIQGDANEYFPGTNSVKSVEHFRQDSLNGPAVYYYESGAKESEGTLRDGYSVGDWIYYYPDGKIKRTELYKDTDLVSAVMFDSLTGKKYQDLVFKNEDGDAHTVYYDDRGKIESEGDLLASGDKSGEWKYYYDNGSLMGIEHFDKDNNTCTYYDSITGDLSIKGQYAAGAATGDWYYYRAGGHLGAIVNYKADISDATGYGKNGKVSYRGHYKGSDPAGEWLYYAENGNLLTKEIYLPDTNILECSAYDSLTGIMRSHGYLRYVKGVKFKSQGRAKDVAKFNPRSIFNTPPQNETNEAAAAPQERRTGEWRYYYPNGHLKGIQVFSADTNTQAAIFYDSVTGEVVSKGRYVNELREGDWQYFKDGRKWKTGGFYHSIQNGSLTGYYEDGRIFYRGQYDMGEKVGNWTFYYDDEKPHLLMTCTCTENFIEGKLFLYDEDGNKLLSAEYLHGIEMSKEYFGDEKKIDTRIRRSRDLQKALEAIAAVLQGIR